METENLKSVDKYFFKEVDFDEVYNSNVFRNLILQNWIETGIFADVELDPDWETYKMVYDSGCLRIYTAWCDERIVGYSVFFVRSHTHYKSTKQAVADMIFISPVHRGFGKNFIAWIDNQLKNEGVIAVYRHATTKNNFSLLLERMGYEQVETIYAKRLD